MYNEGVPIIVIDGNTNEFAYLRASELIEGSWSSVLLRDECDDDFELQAVVDIDQVE